MSKSIEKRSTSTEVSIPAHAKEVEKNNYVIERSINTGILALFNFPTILPFVTSDVNFSLTSSIVGFAGFLLVSLTIPTMGGKELKPETGRNELAIRFAKVPLLNLFANGTYMEKDKDSGKDLIINMKRGNVVIYDITQPNPKDLWDKMYESETGNSVHDDLAMI